MTGDPWEAWALREVSRVTEQVTRDLLRPALEELGVENPEQYSVVYDSTPFRLRKVGDDDRPD